MGRKRKTNKHLPKRMQLKHGAYWYVRSQKWTRLSSDYGEALRMWAEIEDADTRVGKTVANALHAYLVHCGERIKDGDMSPKTKQGYEVSAKSLLITLGEMPLTKVTDQIVRRYRSTRVNKAGRLVPIAANREIALLSASYSHASELGWIPASLNPCKGVKRNRERARRRYVTDAEMTQALKHAPPHLAAAIRIAYCTGMRETDLLKLKLGDITEAGLVVRASKTDKGITYAWTDELRAAVAAAKAIPRRVSSLWLFPSSRLVGEHLTVSGLESAWAKCRVKAGLEDVQWRDWRRKTGSDTDEAHAFELLDHNSPATTKRHYRARGKVVRPVK